MSPSPSGTMAAKPAWPTVSQVAAILFPFAILIAAALLYPMTEQQVTLGRARYTIWVSILFTMPAYVIYFQGSHELRSQVRRLCWTAAFLAYLTHFLYTFLGIHEFSIRGVLLLQTPVVGISNFIFTLCWMIDIALLWLLPFANRGVTGYHRFFQYFGLVVFIVAFVFLRPGVPFYLGILLILAVLGSLLVRIFRDPPAAALEAAAGEQ